MIRTRKTSRPRPIRRFQLHRRRGLRVFGWRGSRPFRSGPVCGRPSGTRPFTRPPREKREGLSPVALEEAGWPRGLGGKTVIRGDVGGTKGLGGVVDRDGRVERR